MLIFFPLQCGLWYLVVGIFTSPVRTSARNFNQFDLSDSRRCVWALAVNKSVPAAGSCRRTLVPCFRSLTFADKYRISDITETKIHWAGKYRWSIFYAPGRLYARWLLAANERKIKFEIKILRSGVQNVETAQANSSNSRCHAVRGNWLEIR